MWSGPGETNRHTGLVRDAFDALQPVSSGGAYVNFLGDDGADRVRAAYGANYARLAKLKSRFDPDNLFRLNQNILPA
jgi:berberine-like enzyme